MEKVNKSSQKIIKGTSKMTSLFFIFALFSIIQYYIIHKNTRVLTKSSEQAFLVPIFSSLTIRFKNI
jgi:hypothetical protein